MKPKLRWVPSLIAFLFSFAAAWAATAPVVLETGFARFQIWPEDGHYEIADHRGNTTWRSNPYQARFGEALMWVNGKQQHIPLRQCDVQRLSQSLKLTFKPLADKPQGAIHVWIKPLNEQQAFEFACYADGLSFESVKLLDDALWITDTDKAYAVVPVREGLMIPADSGKAFTHRFDTSAYEGCHMEMIGLVKNGAAALITWEDPYLAVELKSILTNITSSAKQVVSPSLVTRKYGACAFRMHFLGRGDYVTIAKAYRDVAKEKGYLVTWQEKLKGHPERARLFGTVNYKLWSTLSRSMNEESTKEQSVRVNWTFDEAAQVAEHLKRDLKLDKVFFLMGGWIRRGYDNQHPDILPTAPECGGDAAFTACCKRVRALGYLLGLHDNYQDMYKDAPSWDESYLMKNPDGTPKKGGKWAGGLAYLTCSQRAVELAKRPQNLPKVKELSQADAYFIDTTYAAGLMECSDPKHPLKRWDDLKWKQAISDYGREVFGIFGSECGREWAIPHSDFFEGLTGVSGTYYHDAGLVGKLGGTVVPLFEIVYRDCIAMYGKYGYDASRAAEYVLHHISIGRTLNYHSIPSHLYWKNPSEESRVLALTPSVGEFKQNGPRQFVMRYRWDVEKAATGDWRVLVHFTSPDGKIRFQNDYEPPTPTSTWKVGRLEHGPFTVRIPEGLNGPFDVRIGLFRVGDMRRAQLTSANDTERRCIVGTVQVNGDKVRFEPKATSAGKPAGDAAVFVQAENGWAEGLHTLDRFVKNTYEILSPLNEITSQMRMTEHRFLTSDRKLQYTVFGEGEDAVKVLVNMGTAQPRHETKTAGWVTLPPYGFVVESSVFAAFHALSWNGIQYEKPVMFTLRSLDGKPLKESKQVRVFHAFGDDRIKVGKQVERVTKEKVVSAARS